MDRKKKEMGRGKERKNGEEKNGKKDKSEMLSNEMLYSISAPSLQCQCV